MSGNTITRRGFVAATAGCAALAATAGLTGCATAPEGEAQGAEAVRVRTLCSGCPNGCGMTVWSRGGRVLRASGATGHPRSGGYLCARGQGVLSAAGAEGRLTHPMMRVGDKLVESTWDEVLPQIAQRLDNVGEGLAVVCAEGEDDFFAKRFAWSQGSAKFFTDACLYGADMAAAQACVLGRTATFEPEQADFALLIAPTGAAAATPAQLAAFGQRRAAGEGGLAIAGVREPESARVADEWLPVAPGTELALLLGIAGELVRAGRADRASLDAIGVGFAEFSQAMAGYSLAWAAERTGLDAQRIAQVAARLADAAPCACVSLAGDALGGGSANGFDLARMVLLVNVLLGNVNCTGGMWIDGVDEPDAAALAAQGIPAVEQPAGAKAELGAGSLLAGVQEMASGSVKAAVVVGANPAFDLPGSASAVEALQRVDCLVVMDCFLTETAELADFVLPLLDGTECAGQPLVIHGQRPMAAMRIAAAEAPEGSAAKSVADAFVELGRACGADEAFSVNAEDVARAWCAAMDVDYVGLSREAFTEIPGAAVAEGDAAAFGNESGKVAFASQQARDAGLDAVPAWRDLGVEATPSRPVLVAGSQAQQRGSRTLCAPKLAALARAGELDRAWLSPETASACGVADGDCVRLSTAAGTVEARAKVTNRIHPCAVWLPVHYGSALACAGAAQGFGAKAADAFALETEQTTGAAVRMTALTKIEKAGA